MARLLTIADHFDMTTGYSFTNILCQNNIIYIGLDKEMVLVVFLFVPYVSGALKNNLIEMVLLSTQNIC